MITLDRTIGEEKVDTGFVVGMLLLLGFGLMTLFASTYDTAIKLKEGNALYYFEQQLAHGLIGIVVLVALANIPLEFIRKLLPCIVLFSLVVCLLTFVPGIGLERNGAKRWIQFPLIGQFQPSELAKISIVFYLANLFDKKKDKLNSVYATILPATIGLLSFVLIVFLQNDFSTAIFLFVLGIAIFFVVGVKFYWFILFAFFAVPMGILFIFVEKYRVERVLGFLAPNFDIGGMNYQITAAKKAIASGGFWGQGIGSSIRKIASVPAIQDDFIFVGWTEMMGMFGVVLYFVLLFYFAYRGYKIAFSAKQTFDTLLVFGFTTSIVLQSLMNVGVVVGALPSTGITLPFFSSGGTSLLITLCMCGFIINVSKKQRKEERGDVY